MLINSIDIPNNVILDVLNNSKAHEKELLYVGTLKKKDDKFILENIAYMDVYGDENMVAVHSVISETEVFETINKLRKIGAKDLLVLPIERILENK